MTEDIQLDPAITSGEDIGKGRRGIDWDRVERTLKFEHDTKTQASRQRGRATFNQLISQGVPYAEALRQAGDSGLFEEDSAGWQRMQGHIEDLKTKSSPHQRAIYVPGKGIFESSQDSGKYELTQPIEKPPQPAPIVATQKDPITGATLRMNADQLRGQQIKSTLDAKAALEPQSHVFGAPTYDPVALQKNTDQLKSIRLAQPNSPLPESPIAAPTTEKVKVRKGGKSFMLPKSQLDEALKQGYEVGQ